MPSSSLVDVSSSVLGTSRLLAVEGELDLSSVGKVRQVLDAAFSERPETIVLDLSKIAFCDSSGIRLVVSTQRRAVEQGVRLVVVRPIGPAWRPFEICQIHREVQFVASADDGPVSRSPEREPAGQREPAGHAHGRH